MPIVESAGMSMTSHSLASAGLEVDYDRNLTKLYEAICDSDWDVALQTVKDHPEQARTWVVRYYEEEDYGEKEVMWRFLPLHSACARQPPAPLVSALLKAYNDGARSVDDQGMYALHYACGNQASREVIRLLLLSNSHAAKKKDPRGMLPIHFLAWLGPSSISVIDMVLVANREVGTAKDVDGKTPLDLALEAEYPERDAVAGALRRWMERSASPSSLRTSQAASPVSPRRSQARSPVSPRFNRNLSPSSPRFNRFAAPVSPRFNRTPTSSSPRFKPLAITVDEPEISTVSSARSKKEAREIISPRDTHISDKGGRDSPAASDSNTTVVRLRNDLTKIRAEQNGLRMKCDELSGEVDSTRTRLREKEEALLYTTSELSSTKRLLKECRAERDELLGSVEDLAKDREMYQRKVASMSDRLGSLRVSLAKMADEQEKLMITVKSRGSDLTETSKLRLEKLSMLLALEEETSNGLVRQCRDDDEAIKKQMKEIDDISAVVATLL